MNQFWQLSSALALITLFAPHVQAQNFGPRSWKSYVPGDGRAVSAASKSAVDEAPLAEEDLPPIVAGNARARTIQTSAVKPGAMPRAQHELTSYYDDNDNNTIPPAPADFTGKQDDGSTQYYDPAASQPFDPGIATMGDIGCATACDACQLNDGCGDVCCCCPTRNFARIEYLMWWGRGRALPPLVTTSFDGTDMAEAGVLGLFSTTILYGNNDIGTDWRSGGRLTLGHQLDAEGAWTAVGRFYGLGDSTDSYHAESATGSPILARPFFNALLLQQDALLVAFPGVSTDGVIDIQSRSSMLGADAFVRHAWAGSDCWQVDLLGGYQFSRLDDSLEIRNSELVLLDPQAIFPPNTTISMRDYFRTKNEFHGGVLGLAADFYRGPWTLSLLGKMAIGNQRQSVTIEGGTLIAPEVGPAVQSPNGLLARSTNIGQYSRDVFTFVPEANFTLAYQQNNWTFTMGYSFLYWNDVAWAGDQIDTRVNLSNPVIGDQVPAFAFRDTDFWLQGISFGVEFNF
ncbi:hypothetical protein ETAA8_48360 [Anatilimnocola aggregata]|uniref:Uncharacterized protein n=1 Tax=Anatilimnocola aggregata TaxID=2528021 RepID=A0A517YHM3_9BACT|nr:BBP7 family outer membrane beta-barrel protein [Anatilimnocola aggregata]QDU29721.1 hypothetical protein ETAA8_48360 [Anatilimnocola aggregata]